MDTKIPNGYDYMEKSVDDSIRDTDAIIRYIRRLDQRHEPLVQPIITPRFALSCSHELFKNLSSLAASEPTLRIQVHISENKTEVCKTLEIFEDVARSYAGIYDAYGLLRENTILGHAVHLTEEEVKLIKQRGAGISHCPTSNFNLNSGIAPIGYYLDRGVKVRLFSSVLDGIYFYSLFLRSGWAQMFLVDTPLLY